MKNLGIYISLSVMALFITGAVNSMINYSDWELDCEDMACRGIKWDSVETIEVPFTHLDSLTHPPCTVKVFVQKRRCDTITEMKILGYESNGCLNEISAGSTMYDIMGKIWNKNNYFGILPDSAPQGIRIYRSPCWAEIEYIDKSDNSVHKMFVPCEKACCISNLSVWKNGDCYDGIKYDQHNTGTRMSNVPWCSASAKDDSTGQYSLGKFLKNIKKKDLGWLSDLDTTTYSNFKIVIPKSITVLDTTKLTLRQGCQYNCGEEDAETIMRSGQFYRK